MISGLQRKRDNAPQVAVCGVCLVMKTVFWCSPVPVFACCWHHMRLPSVFVPDVAAVVNDDDHGWSLLSLVFAALPAARKVKKFPLLVASCAAPRALVRLFLLVSRYVKKKVRTF